MDTRRRLLSLPFIGLLAVACSTAGAASGPGLEVGSTPAPVVAGISGTPGAELLLAGLSTFDAGDAGVVSLGLDGGRLVVREVGVDPGWTQQTKPHGDNGIEVRFSGPDGAETRFEADLGSDGTLDVDLRERRTAADDVKTISLLQAGTVTYTVAGGVVSLNAANANLAGGWDLTERDDEDGFEVDLTNAALLSKVEFRARTSGDRLELETELRVGPGFESSEDDNADAADDGDLATPGPSASPSPQPTERPRPTARPTARPTQGAGATETPKATDDDDDDGRETETPEPTDDDDDDDNSGPGGGGGGDDDDDDDNSGPGGGGGGGGSGGGHGSGSGGGDSSGPGGGGSSGSDDD